MHYAKHSSILILPLLLSLATVSRVSATPASPESQSARSVEISDARDVVLTEQPTSIAQTDSAPQPNSESSHGMSPNWLLVPLMGASLLWFINHKGNKSEKTAVETKSTSQLTLLDTTDQSHKNPSLEKLIPLLDQPLSWLVKYWLHKSEQATKSSEPTTSNKAAQSQNHLSPQATVAPTEAVLTATHALGDPAQQQSTISIEPVPQAVTNDSLESTVRIHWTIPPQQQQSLQEQGGKRLILRLYDVTQIDLNNQPAHSFHQYQCDETAQELTVPTLANHDYVAELGYLTIDGRLLRLVRSAQPASV
jgi:hypothetical protein